MKRTLGSVRGAARKGGPYRDSSRVGNRREMTKFRPRERPPDLQRIVAATDWAYVMRVAPWVTARALPNGHRIPSVSRV